MADVRALLLNMFNQDKKWCVFFDTEVEGDCKLWFGTTVIEVLIASIFRRGRKDDKYENKDIRISKIYLKDGEPLLNEISYEELRDAGFLPPEAMD